MNRENSNDPILRVLLVEDDSAICAEFISYTDTLTDVELVGVTDNSYTGFDLVRNLKPDALILDLELHAGGGNGLFLLRDMQSLAPSEIPYTIVTTNNTSNTTFETARRLGAGFIFTKHQSDFSPQATVDMLRLMAPVIKERKGSTVRPEEAMDLAEHNRRKLICAKFDTLGMSNKALGYKYLVDAVSITMEKPTPNLSFILSRKYQKSVASIERAMQNAIERTWNTVPLDVLTTNYTAHINPDREMPTTMEFISYYAERLKSLTP